MSTPNVSVRDWLAYALSGHVVVSIGQLTIEDKRTLERAVRKGQLVKWRGHWWPIDGHPTFGIGPLKMCYAVENPYAGSEQ